MPSDRLWGKLKPIDDEKKARIGRLLRECEELPYTAIAYREGVGISTVQKINRELRIRTRSPKSK